MNVGLLEGGGRTEYVNLLEYTSFKLDVARPSDGKILADLMSQWHVQYPYPKRWQYHGYHLGRATGHGWMLNSPGPDRKWGGLTNNEALDSVTNGYPNPLDTIALLKDLNMNWGVYDSTNGTVSVGHIFRTRKLTGK